MSNVRRWAALLVTLVAVLSTAVLSPAALLTPAAARRISSVAVAVESVTPSTPPITSGSSPVTITLSLRNTTGTALTGVQVTAERGDPITTQAALTASLADPAARKNGRPVAATHASSLTLPPDATVTTTFTTTASTSTQDNAGICLCIAAAVYPIDLTVHSSGGGAALGSARTYLPSFDVTPKHTLGVTWVWPLIDRPHRNTSDTVFTDDELTLSTSTGRLDRALQVVEEVAGTVPLTLEVDPELIDELFVMSQGTYTVRAPNGHVSAGTGQLEASAWLSRLQAVLAAHPDIDIEFTPLADPDVTSLTQHGETWSSTLPAAVAADVTTALGNRAPAHTLAWPPTDSATVSTLDRLVSGGARTVLLDSSRVRPSTKAGIPVSAARLRTSTGTVNALLTSPALQRYAQAALTGSAAALPALMSELAVRVAQRPNTVQGAVLTAPRYVDPTPDLAAATIRATSASVFSRPVSARDALAALPASTPPGAVRAPVATSSGLSAQQLTTIRSLTGYLAPVASLIGGPTGSPAGRDAVATLPAAVQRAESAAWSSAGAAATVGGGPTAGRVRTTALTAQLTGYLGDVRILPPQSGSYTLADGDSPLPISVRNDSPLLVHVKVSLASVGGLPGLSARPPSIVGIPGNSKLTIKIPTSVQRSGRIPVQAQLATPDGYALGNPVRLFVHSTVLGTIGVVITIVAGAVLVLALLVRYIRRVARIRGKRNRSGTGATSTRKPRAAQEPVR